MLKGDEIVQFGMLQKGRSLLERFAFQPELSGGKNEAFLEGCQYKGVQQSISPVVRALVGLPIGVIVRRAPAEPPAAEGPGGACVRLTLTPERWSGQGLLGCILK